MNNGRRLLVAGGTALALMAATPGISSAAGYVPAGVLAANLDHQLRTTKHWNDLKSVKCDGPLAAVAKAKQRCIATDTAGKRWVAHIVVTKVTPDGGLAYRYSFDRKPLP